MSDDNCGHPTADGTPCQNPATEGDSCWIPAHGGSSEGHGRPSTFTEEKQEAIYTAVETGLKAHHVASAAGISVQTLRRWTCCINDLREAILADDPCDFCKGYADAHAEGAREVLEDASPEFRASASFGYTKTEKKELENTGDDPLANLVFDFEDADT